MSYHGSQLSEAAREQIIARTQASDGSAEYKLQSLCYSVLFAEKNFNDAKIRGFDTAPYEIELARLTAKLSVALEPLVTGKLPEKIQKRLDAIYIAHFYDFVTR